MPSASSTLPAPAATSTVLRRTQFDGQLLPGGETTAPRVARNHGRQVLCLPGGSTIAAQVWGGDAPVLRVWRNRELIAEHLLLARTDCRRDGGDTAGGDAGATFNGAPSAPCLIGGPSGEVILWISVGERVAASTDPRRAPLPVAGLRGTLLDAGLDARGRTALLLAQNGRLLLASSTPERTVCAVLDEVSGRGSLDFGPDGALHIAYEKRQGIEYRRLEAGFDAASPAFACAERAAEAFGFHPVVLAGKDRVFLAYRGESCRLPGPQRYGPAWERLGRGGYVAALVREGGAWRRFRLADSHQFVKSLRSIDDAYGGGPDGALRARLDEFGPPALSIGPDGVAQVLWTNVERRWIYSARYLGEDFAAGAEVRGPIEQLSVECLAPKRAPRGFAGTPVAFASQTRVYLDELRLPARETAKGRRIDFVQPDDLAECRGAEAALSPLSRRPENPVIPVGPPGSFDDAAVVADIHRDGEGWRADYSHIHSKNADPNSKDRGWKSSGRAVSADGIRWTKLDPLPLAERYTVDGAPVGTFPIRYVEDRGEPDPARRFKGLWRSKAAEPWGWLAVTSHDARTWASVPDRTAVLRADDDLRLWVDLEDESQRRFKAIAISRSFCGRVCAQWTSADGMHWRDERETLDFKDPFGAKPDRGSTGRILLDSWSGPEDEDEIHGGYVFRDGERWLLHYMKWTADGHIYPALASSRDGLNFTRVLGGETTLPLGAPGAWDAGRIAFREAPFRLGDVWRQYYTGCGWKHGIGGVGAKTSHVGIDAPNQMGAAEIAVGRWTHLRVRREADAAELVTVALELAAPHALSANVEGLCRQGSALAVAVLDAEGGRPIEGFTFNECDVLGSDGLRAPVTWKGRGLEALGRRSIRLAVRFSGHGLKLFGFDLRPAG